MDRSFSEEVIDVATRNPSGHRWRSPGFGHRYIQIVPLCVRGKGRENRVPRSGSGAGHSGLEIVFSLFRARECMEQFEVLKAFLPGLQ